MRIVQSGKYELIVRTSPDGPALLVLKAEELNCEFHIEMMEVLQLVQALGVGPTIASLLGKVIPS